MTVRNQHHWRIQANQQKNLLSKTIIMRKTVIMEVRHISMKNMDMTLIMMKTMITVLMLIVSSVRMIKALSCHTVIIIITSLRKI